MLATLLVCENCKSPYEWQKSQSALKLTYCGILCEQSGLGFSIDGFIRSEITLVRRTEPRQVALPVAVEQPEEPSPVPV
jgi:hypothetical protein